MKLKQSNAVAMSDYNELATNICKELAIEPDAQVLVILATAIQGAVEAALRAERQEIGKP